VNTSIFLARLIGPISLVGGISLFMNTEGYKGMAREFLRSPSLIYLSGLLTMTVGLAVVLNHNLWVSDWRVLLTVFGWLAAIGGAARIAFPDRIRSIGESMLDSPAVIAFGGAVWIVFGAIFCFFGYFA
jgi:hypothetical protein